MKDKNIYAIGDTHALNYLRILRHYDMRDFVLCHVGDSGVGFSHMMDDRHHIRALQKFCEDRNGEIIVIRGNHDDPSFFQEGTRLSEDFPLVQFVPDFTYRRINGKSFLFVGGSISIDRQFRVEGKDWWRGEEFVLQDDYESLPQCDVLITHGSGIDELPFPSLRGSPVEKYLKADPDLEWQLPIERQKIQKLINHSNCKVHLFGHHHTQTSEYINGYWSRGLDINEVIQLNNYL